jgi:ubiquitin carboxyl-terminal hydrolase 4/11/15
LLDEENKWYCTKCKDHVQATKKLEIYRPPSILVVSLKRFKGGKKSMYGYGNSSMGSKLSTLVDFPLSGLDMAPFILS